MKDSQQRKDLASLLERRRRDLLDRSDISQRTRELSQSSGRNPIGSRPVKRRAALTLLLGALAVVVMLACVVTAVTAVAGSFWVQNQLNDPGVTAQQFYSALHQQDYAQAYSYFSSNAKSRLSESAFADKYASYDQVSGIIDSYPVTKSTINGSSATLTINVVRRGNSTVAQVQTLQLVSENGSWRIQTITFGSYVPLPTPTA